MRYVQQNGILVPHTARHRQRGFITCGPSFFGTQGGSASTTWSVPDSSPYLTFSNGNLTMAPSPGLGISALAYGSSYKTAGKWYFEITDTSMGASNYSCIGVLLAGQATTYAVGQTSDSWAYYEQTGASYHNNVTAGFGAPYTTGDVIGVAIDVGAGDVWFSKNGTWQGSGNPSTGANPVFTGIGNPIYPGASVYASNGSTLTAAFAASGQVYAAPSGFTSWG